MRKNYRNAYLILAVILTVVTLSSCKKKTDGKDHIFIYDLLGNPHTLDPQTAVDENAKLVIANLYDGLLRQDPSGKVTHGTAMEYEISDDLVTYTFYLKENVYWKSKNGFTAQCTAKDFVFAFRRLFNPEVKSANAPDYYCILNAQQVHMGELPLEEIGVTAKSDFVLEIVLNSPNSEFSLLLTEPPSFPCNEDFYLQTEGRYGLIADTVASNGGFYLTNWIYDPHWVYENKITLRRNEFNYDNGDEKVLPLGINFLMDRGSQSANFKSGDSDCIVISGNSADELIKSKYPYTGAENVVWGIRFNDNGLFESTQRDLRLAIVHSVDESDVFSGTKQKGFRKANAIIPDSIKIDGTIYRDIAGATNSLTQSESQETVNGYYSAVSRAATARTVRPVLIIPETTGREFIEKSVKSLSQFWEKYLSLSCTIEVLPSHEYELRLQNGDYDIAVTKLSAAFNSPSSLLELLSSLSGESENINALLQQARLGNTTEEIAASFLSAENAIIESLGFVPLCFMTEYFFTAKDSEGLVYNPFNKTVNFRYGKMY